MTENNDILFAGDPHGSFKAIISAVLSYRPKAIILLGDYNLEASLEQYLQPIIGLTQVYWIPGNHDFDSQSEYENLYHSALKDNNLHLTVRVVAGLKIAGLGGIFMGKNWMPGQLPKWQDKRHWLKYTPRNVKKIPLKLDHSIWHHEYERMKNTIRADILVTHEAPSCHRYGFQAIDELAQAIGAKAIIHGHHHEYYQDTLHTGINVTGVAMQRLVNLAGDELMHIIR